MFASQLENNPLRKVVGTDRNGDARRTTMRRTLVIAFVLFVLEHGQRVEGKPLADDDAEAKAALRWSMMDERTKDTIGVIIKKIKACKPGEHASLTAEETIILKVYWDFFGKEFVSRHAIPLADKNFGKELAQMIGLKDEKTIEDFKFKFGLLTGHEKFALGMTLKQINAEGQKRLCESQRELMLPFLPLLSEFLKKHP
jgi:hypothetical protein